MRIVYGIHGYGRGHATRAMAVLPELMERHQVLILAGGDAYDLLREQYAVYRIPTLRYYYGKGTQRSNYHTFIRNFPSVMDLWLHGPAMQSVCETIEDFRTDVIISDAESWTHTAARRLKIPRIGFDHFGIMVYCRPDVAWYDKIGLYFDGLSYRTMMGQPERVIVSSFYDCPPRREGVSIVGTLLRQEVRRTQASDGDYLLVYLNKGEHQFTPSVKQALMSLDCPVRVYGVHERRPEGNLIFRPPSNLPFVEDLAGCRAVFSTAGNQLVGEAIYFGKPMLVGPESSVEQRLNASAIERLGIGMRTKLSQVTPDIIREFLNREREYKANIHSLVQDGQAEAVRMLEQFMSELVVEPASGDVATPPGPAKPIHVAGR